MTENKKYYLSDSIEAQNKILGSEKREHCSNAVRNIPLQVASENSKVFLVKISEKDAIMEKWSSGLFDNIKELSPQEVELFKQSVMSAISDLKYALRTSFCYKVEGKKLIEKYENLLKKLESI